MRTDVREHASSPSSSPDSTSGSSVVLLVAHSEAAEQLAELERGKLLPKGHAVVIEQVSGPWSAAVERARAERGGCPIGVVAASDAEALEAMTAGADEALPLASVDLPSVLSLLDRTVVRASSRRQRERDHEAIIQSEKLAALGTIIASVAHEVNNPLTSVLLSLEAMGEKMARLDAIADKVRQLDPMCDAPVEKLQQLMTSFGSGELAVSREMIQEAKVAARSISEIVRDLLIFARGGADEQPRLVFVPDLIDQVLRIVGHQVRKQAVIERDDGSDLPPILVPRTRVAMVLTNILVNASHAMREVDRPCHRVRISTRADNEALAISISDTGPGIPADVIPHIFDPFFTTKREAMGTGLGLSISRSTLTKLGGDLIVESVHGQGATFVVVVPLPDRASVVQGLKTARSAFVPRSTASRVTVLLVDDDERVLKAYARALHDRYDLLVAADGQEAIDLLRSGSEPDAIVSDVDMPTVDGERFHNWVGEQRPGLSSKFIFVSAGMTPEAQALRDRSDVTFLTKPVARSELVEAIELTLSRNERSDFHDAS